MKLLTVLRFLMALTPWMAKAQAFDCLDLSAHEKGAAIYQELRTIQKDLALNQPELTRPATAVGYCQDLDKSFLPVFLNPVENTYPPRCAGFTFSVQTRAQAASKIKEILNFKSTNIQGESSTVEVHLAGVTFTLPICLDVLDELVGIPESDKKSTTD